MLLLSSLLLIVITITVNISVAPSQFYLLTLSEKEIILLSFYGSEFTGQSSGQIEKRRTNNNNKF